MIYDMRWRGNNGIGRFSSELSKRLKFDGFIDSQHVSPTSIFDSAWLTWRLFIQKIKCGDFLYVSPGYNSPLLFQGKCVITVHDLNHIDLPYNSSMLKKVYYSLVLKRTCKKCKLIFTVSDFSKKRIIEWAGVNPDKVVNIGNGVDIAFQPNVEAFHPGYEYFLCIGNRKEHKNEKSVVTSFLSSSIPNDVKLVFNGQSTPELDAIIDRFDSSSRVVFLGRVDEADMPSVYAGASGLIFPSLYEGFGLPVIEAMACGVPVITSNVTSLPEVAGNAALLVDPYSTSEISSAIERVYFDKDFSSKMIAAGLFHSKSFTWDSVARKASVALSTFTRDV